MSSEPKPDYWLIAQWREGLTHEQFRRGISDIVQGWNSRTLWWTMGIQDIRQRYRRSVIGPFWLTLSMGIMVGALGLLYGRIFNQPLDEYLPYLSAGFVVWGLISSLLLEGSNAFIQAEGLIRQLAMPFSIHVYRLIWKAFIVFAHNIWIVAIVLLWFGKNPGWAFFSIIPALILVALNGLWIGLFLGLLCARFRDIPQIIASVVQVVFFLTPIIWRPTMLSGRTALLDYNPFYHFVELVRQPMLGQVPSLETWGAVLGITLIGWCLALLFYTTYRWRISYWV